MLSAALFGFWLAVSRFNENRGYRLWTYAKDWVRKYIRLCIKDWRREGAAGETRQDRFIFSNGAATAEQVVAAAGGGISNAERAIARHNTQHENYREGANDHCRFKTADDSRGTRYHEPVDGHDMRRMYDCFKAHQLSPQLRDFTVAVKAVVRQTNHDNETVVLKLTKPAQHAIPVTVQAKFLYRHAAGYIDGVL